MMATEVCKTCGGSIYEDDGERKCFACGRLSQPAPAHVEPDKEGSRMNGEVRQKRRYVKKADSAKPGRKLGTVLPEKELEPVKEVDAAVQPEKRQEPLAKGAALFCIGCPIKAELARLTLVHKGYRAAISDLGGHNATE